MKHNGMNVSEMELMDVHRFMATMRVTVLENKYIPHDPTPKQAEFLLLQDKEALYGGAAGGGKVMRS